MNTWRMNKMIKLQKTNDGSFNVTLVTEEGDFAPAKLQGLSDDKVMSLWSSSRRRTDARIALDGLCDMASVDTSVVVDIIKDQYKDLIKVVSTGKEEDEPLPDIAFSSLDLDYKDEVGAICVASTFYKLRDPPWIMALGDPSTGKSTWMKHFKHPSLSTWMGRATENASNPGSASGDDRNTGYIERNDGKTLLINEATTFYSGNESTIYKHVATLTDIFGQGCMGISDVVDDREIEANINVMMGMTWRAFYKNIDYINANGQRFLVLPFETNRRRTHWDDEMDGEDEIPLKIAGAIDRCHRLHPKLPKGTKAMQDVAHEFAVKLTMLRSLLWANKPTVGEQQDRLAKQLYNMARIRAALNDREPTAGDVKHFFKLAYLTVPKRDAIYSMVSKNESGLPMETDDEKLLHKHVVSLGMLTKEWRDFMKKVTRQ